MSSLPKEIRTVQQKNTDELEPTVRFLQTIFVIGIFILLKFLWIQFIL